MEFKQGGNPYKKLKVGQYKPIPQVTLHTKTVSVTTRVLKTEYTVEMIKDIKDFYTNESLEF